MYIKLYRTIGHGHCQICVGRFYRIYRMCGKINVVLLLAVTVYKSNRLHGVNNTLNIYSNICTYRLLLCLQTFNKVKSTTFIVFLGVTCKYVNNHR